MTEEQVQLATVAARMRELIGSAEWAVYRDAVNALASSLIDQLLLAPAANHDAICGRINGIRDALSLPNLYITRSKQHASRD